MNYSFTPRVNWHGIDEELLLKGFKRTLRDEGHSEEYITKLVKDCLNQVVNSSEESRREDLLAALSVHVEFT